MSGELDQVITQGAAQAQMRLDDGQFALRSFQPRASSVRNVQALALHRRYPVSCAQLCVGLPAGLIIAMGIATYILRVA
jgi:hypothetical protein